MSAIEDARIRLATPQDAEAVGRLLVAAWRESYANLFPPQALANLDEGERARQARPFLDSSTGDGAAFLLTRDGEPPCGFGHWSRQKTSRLAAAGYAAEFSSLYLLRRAQRRGLGRALWRTMATDMVARGFSSASLWVFRDNVRARRFYEALGGETTGIEGEWTGLGASVEELSYGWRDLTRLGLTNNRRAARR